MADYSNIVTTFVPVVSVLLGALATLSTLLFVNLRNVRREVLIEQMDIYSEFWSDTHADTRRRIAVDAEYERLKEVLERRRALNGMGGLDAAEYEILEALDRFLSIFVRIESLNAAAGRSITVSSHLARFRAYWLGQVRGRKALDRYIQSCWPALTTFPAWRD